MRSVLTVARQFYRVAQDASADAFEDLALAALGEQLRFASALWFRGGFADGQFHFHRLHAYRLPPAAMQPLISVIRQFSQAIALSAASPGIPQVSPTADGHAQPSSRTALECVRRWGLDRQMTIVNREDGSAAGEWLSLYRSATDASFDQRDRTLLRVLMPHLAESRSVNRALSLARASHEPFLAPGRHRALTLLDGTVLHCGTQLSDSIARGWPEWDGMRLPWRLLQKLTREGSVSVEPRGEVIGARRFSDSLLLTVKSRPLADRLTRREQEVVQLFGTGRACKEIAQRCGLSPATVRNIVQRSYRKLGVNNKAQLAQLISGADGEP